MMTNGVINGASFWFGFSVLKSAHPVLDAGYGSVYVPSENLFTSHKSTCKATVCTRSNAQK
jgi:hypothetical protein